VGKFFFDSGFIFLSLDINYTTKLINQTGNYLM
ncbi:hypothetical protein CP03DC29_0950B, partial [Chlamydia psittaci 03DC29]